jgi:hypothetical protein
MTEFEGRVACFECIGESYLSAVVKGEGRAATCNYCREINPAIEIADLADRVEAVFNDHYERTSSEPNFYESMMHRDREIDYNWDREGVPVVDLLPDLLDVCQEIAVDLHAVLKERHEDWDASLAGEETEFDDEVQYEEILPNHEAWSAEWDGFVHRLRHHARHFDRNASAYLDRLFSGIAGRTTHQGQPVLVTAGPGGTLDRLWRGRVFQSARPLHEALARPDRHLGPPPANFAGAGRLNARGIALFYGATSQEVALAEVRPPVGSNVAMVEFEIIRPLKLLDLDALAEMEVRGSIFDPKHTEALRQASFLRELVGHFAAPVLPDDAEMAYLPTQVVADFLANWSEPRLDGILYRSVQAAESGRNVALFYHAAAIEPMDVPEKSEIEVHFRMTSDEGDWDYFVSETVPPEGAEAAPTPPDQLANGWGTDIESVVDRDIREPALRVAQDRLHVHEVRAVVVQTELFEVTRYRSTRGDNDAF